MKLYKITKARLKKSLVAWGATSGRLRVVGNGQAHYKERVILRLEDDYSNYSLCMSPAEAEDIGKRLVELSQSNMLNQKDLT